MIAEFIQSVVLQGITDDLNKFARELVSNFAVTAKKIVQNTKMNGDVKSRKLRLLNEQNIQMKPTINERQMKDRLAQHLTYVRKWAGEIYFKEATNARRISDIYVALDAYVMPSHKHLSPEEKNQKVLVERAFSSTDRNLIFLGLPGAGKTTSMKKLVGTYLNNKRLQEENRLPILVRLRDLDQDYPGEDHLTHHLSQLLGFRMEFDLPAELTSDIVFLNKPMSKARISSMARYLEHLKPLVILDGFDEIATNQMKSCVLREVSEFSRYCDNVRIVLSSRTGEIGAPIDFFDEYEIAPLSNKQIAEFVDKWLKSPSKRQAFLKQIKHSPYSDTAMKPLSLAHLCAIFERTRTIPDQPKTVYKRVVWLMLEEWDEQRGVTRVSRYSKFDTHRKYEFLCNLAYYFSVTLKKYVVTEKDFQNAYGQLSTRFKLAASERDDVIKELESHTGLIIQSGANQFEFAHKSVQEFLCAEHIVRLSKPPGAADVQNLSSELAVSIAISSEPGEYLCNLIKSSLLHNSLPRGFYYSLLNRIYLEKPDFEDEATAFVGFISLFSLWFTNGTLPKVKELSQIDWDQLETSTFPPVWTLFSNGSWEKWAETFGRSLFSNSSNEAAIELKMRSKKHKDFLYVFDTLILPLNELATAMKIKGVLKNATNT